MLGDTVVPEGCAFPSVFLSAGKKSFLMHIKPYEKGGEKRMFILTRSMWSPLEAHLDVDITFVYVVEVVKDDICICTEYCQNHVHKGGDLFTPALDRYLIPAYPSQLYERSWLD